MSGPALIAELTSLAQEARRKNPEIRTAADRSLQDLKSLPNTSEQQLAADLSRRPAFIEPFLLACATRNPKYAASAANCLQRLVIIKGLPKTRLKDVLDAFNACTSLSLEIQLKVLQALPALAQSYSDDLKGEQLAGALQVCAALQNAKAATVSGVAAATLQQLVVSVFDKVAAEDAKPTDQPAVTEVPGDKEPIPLKEAAYDAYRVFLDICLATEGRKPKFVQFAGLSPASGLELVWACLNTHSQIFASHPEQINIVRSLILPYLIRVVSERQGFGITLRAIRVASLVIRQHLQAMPDECEMILGLFTHMLDPEAAATWKRVMCMEVYRSIYTESGLALQVYLQYDAQEGKRPIIRDNIAVFVRISTEKPAVIGLGQQSSIPTGPANQKEVSQEQVVVEAAGGVAGVIGAALGVGEANVPGISTQWSTPKTQCMDQLDKAEPPPIPETYVYSLVLESLNGLSENLAKVVLPLTVQHENARPRKSRSQEDDIVEEDLDSESKVDAPSPSQAPKTRAKRSQSYRARAVPMNPLSSEHNPPSVRVKAIAGLVEECWPALLATYSTFLYAALDDNYYRALIRSYQRFLQVSGLLRLTTARDALLTTLSKSAVPPNMVNASLSGALSPTTESPSIYQNARGLLSVDSFANQSPVNEKTRRVSGEPVKPTLTMRNLLCLRALLNVAIAIGPTLGSSFTIIFEALQQAGVVLNSMGPQQRDSKSSSRTGSEVAAVEAAALRLLESTADYPNDAFFFVLSALSKLLDAKPDGTVSPNTQESTSPLPSPRLARRISSLPGVITDFAVGDQDYLFVLTRLGELSDLNVARFASYNANESGWKTLAERLVEVSITASIPNDARRLAADILRRGAVAIAEQSTIGDEDEAVAAQRLALSSLQMLVRQLYAQNDELTSIDIEIHAKVLDAVRSILEKSGEALTAGWDIILAILSSVFDDEDEEPSPDPSTKPEEGWLRLSSQIIAPYLGREAFGAMQLICSDFLASLPETCLSPLIEILYHFTSQDIDLNISLTTITLFWDVSDFLVKQDAVSGLNDAAARIKDGSLRLTHSQIVSQSSTSRSSQWVLLLYRLADTISDDRTEVRNSAFQTILRIFNNHGDDFTTPAWQLALETLLLRVLQENVAKQKTLRAEKVNAAIVALDSTSRTLLEDTASLISQNLAAITPSSSFTELWSALVGLLRNYLSYQSSVVSAAVFNSLTTILRPVAADDEKWTPLIEEVSSLWAVGIPGVANDVKGQDAEQEAFLAYADCEIQIYRLKEKTITPEEIFTTAANLVECVRSSKGGYGVDASNPTPLQKRVLGCLKELRTNIDTVPSTLIKTASNLVTLPFEKEQNAKLKSSLTFVALAKEAMDWLVVLVPSHLHQADIFTSGAVALSLESLAVPIQLKYEWKQNGKAPAPWQKATPVTLSIIEPTLAQMLKLEVGQEIKTRVWASIVSIAQAIMNADLSKASPAPTIQAIESDESSDCSHLTKLRNMIIPAVGSATISASIRSTYNTSLLHASIIHAPERGDIPADPNNPPRNLSFIRLGRVSDPPPTLRETMAYLCLADLIALTTRADPAGTSPERVELAKAAAPSLVLRLALPLKAYIADQPLRGSMPQPLSQKEELLFVLSAMRTLRCEPAAAAKDGEGSKMHLRLLYPLVVKAVGVAGDRRHGNSEVLSALQGVLDVAGHEGDD